MTPVYAGRLSGTLVCKDVAQNSVFMERNKWKYILKTGTFDALVSFLLECHILWQFCMTPFAFGCDLCLPNCAPYFMPNSAQSLRRLTPLNPWPSCDGTSADCKVTTEQGFANAQPPPVNSAANSLQFDLQYPSTLVQTSSSRSATRVSVRCSVIFWGQIHDSSLCCESFRNFGERK